MTQVSEYLSKSADFSTSGIPLCIRQLTATWIVFISGLVCNMLAFTLIFLGILLDDTRSDDNTMYSISYVGIVLLIAGTAILIFGGIRFSLIRERLAIEGYPEMHTALDERAPSTSATSVRVIFADTFSMRCNQQEQFLSTTTKFLPAYNRGSMLEATKRKYSSTPHLQTSRSRLFSMPSGPLYDADQETTDTSPKTLPKKPVHNNQFLEVEPTSLNRMQGTESRESNKRRRRRVHSEEIFHRSLTRNSSQESSQNAHQSNNKRDTKPSSSNYNANCRKDKRFQENRHNTLSQKYSMKAAKETHEKNTLSYPRKIRKSELDPDPNSTQPLLHLPEYGHQRDYFGSGASERLLSQSSSKNNNQPQVDRSLECLLVDTSRHKVVKKRENFRLLRQAHISSESSHKSTETTI